MAHGQLATMSSGLLLQLQRSDLVRGARGGGAFLALHEELHLATQKLSKFSYRRNGHGSRYFNSVNL